MELLARFFDRLKLLGLLPQIVLVVTDEIPCLPLFDLNDPGGDAGQKRRVMGNEDDGPGEFSQCIGQHIHGGWVQMVRRLIEEQGIGGFDQHAGEGHPVSLTPLNALIGFF